MRIHITILLLCFLCGGYCMAQPLHIPMSVLMEMGKWEESKIEPFLKSKGFTYDPMFVYPNEWVPLRRYMGDTLMIGEHTAPSPYEGDDPFKRTVLYCNSYASSGDGDCVFLRYYTSDPEEYDSMQEYVQSMPQFQYDAELDAYSDGKYHFRLRDERIKLNIFGRGGFIRRYMFNMITPKKYLK